MKQYYKNTIALWQRLVVVRRILAKVAKTVLYVIRDDTQLSCTRTTSWGTEAVFHAVRYVLNHNDSGAILLVDSTNAFTH